MRYFCRLIWYFAALGTLLCSCGGSHHGDRLVEAGEAEFFSVVERPQGGWTVVSVSPFDGSSDTLVVDKPMTNIIVMSTSHYGFLDALGRTDVISGISGPDYLWTNSGFGAAEASSGGSTASLCEAPPLASLRSAPVPPLSVPRVAAVAGAVVPPSNLTSVLRGPVEEWKGLLVNDFEATVFKAHPELAAIKQSLYDSGAVYAAMSGSGSALFGIYKK